MIAPSSTSLAAPFLQFFFAEHLIIHRRVSPETVPSYRDTFRLLLLFVNLIRPTLMLSFGPPDEPTISLVPA